MSVDMCATGGPVLTDDDRTLVETMPCCMGVAVYGTADRCTCWTPTYDQLQQPAQPGDVVTRHRTCIDCAYLPNSPERREDPAAMEGLENFWCHQGMRRVVSWTHEDGRARPAHDGDYEPLRDAEIVYRADGRPAQRCAGWAGEQAAMLAAVEAEEQVVA